MDKPWSLSSQVISNRRTWHLVSSTPGNTVISSPGDNQSSLVAGAMQPSSKYNFCAASTHNCLALPSVLIHMKEMGINELLQGQTGTSSTGTKLCREKLTDCSWPKQRQSWPTAWERAGKFRERSARCDMHSIHSRAAFWVTFNKPHKVM